MWKEQNKPFRGVRIRRTTTFPWCYQFPKFLLEIPVSQTAKIIYMILYERARLSSKNDWVDASGNVFIIYPLNELVEDSGRSISAVKIAVKELEHAGLLEKEPGGFGRPNKLYVMVQPEFEPYQRPVPSPAEVRKRAPSNNTMSNTEKSNTLESDSEPAAQGRYRASGCAMH